jgi:hypothetical protein
MLLALANLQHFHIEEGKLELEAALKLRPDDADARKPLEIPGALGSKPDDAN